MSGPPEQGSESVPPCRSVGPSITWAGKRKLVSLCVMLLAAVLSLSTTWLTHTHTRLGCPSSAVRLRFTTLQFHEFLGLPRSQCPYYIEYFEVDKQKYATNRAFKVFCDEVSKRVRPVLRDDRHYFVYSVMRPERIGGWPFLSHPYTFRIEVWEWLPGKEGTARQTWFRMNGDGSDPRTSRVALVGNFGVHWLIWAILLWAGHHVVQQLRKSQQKHQRGFPVLPG